MHVGLYQTWQLLLDYGCAVAECLTMQTIASCTRQCRFRGPFEHSESGTSDLLLPLRFQPGQSGLGRNVRRRVVTEGSMLADGGVEILTRPG